MHKLTITKQLLFSKKKWIPCVVDEGNTKWDSWCHSRMVNVWVTCLIALWNKSMEHEKRKKRKKRADEKVSAENFNISQAPDRLGSVFYTFCLQWLFFARLYIYEWTQEKRSNNQQAKSKKVKRKIGLITIPYCR